MKKFVALILAGIMLFSHVGTVFGGNYIVSAAETTEFTSDKSVIADKVREAMVQRQENVTIYYTYPGVLDNDFLKELMDLVLAETGNPKEGDYLRWHYKKASARLRGVYDGDVVNYTIALSLDYYTTKEQEAAVDQTIAQVLKEIGVSDRLSDYDNIKKIYDYIAGQVKYDYKNLNDDNYTLKYTAYAALLNKTAVCQGYANLTYRMLKEAGIDTRIIAGYSRDQHHAWNIVELDNQYYYLDTTWDAQRTNYNYFLNGSNNFEEHISSKEYTTSEFEKKYPISETDYTLSQKHVPFSDIQEDDWYYNAVKYNYDNGMMTGKTEKTFAPNESLVRAQFASVLHRITGAPTIEYRPMFPDVNKDAWYVTPVLWAKGAGIVNGYKDGSFGPDAPITREQMAIMMFNYANFLGYDTSMRADLNRFLDASSVSEWAETPMQWAVGAGIISGTSGGLMLNPHGNTPRAQCAVIICNFMEKYDNK